MVIDPDYNSKSGQSVRVIGYSGSAEDLISIIIVRANGKHYGANGWVSNYRDRRTCAEGEAT